MCLDDEKDGVSLLKSMPDLGKLLDRAVAKGMFGTKMRSVVHRASPTGIAAIVAQQFDIAVEIAARGLVPIVEPEVSIKAPDKAVCEALLLDAMHSRLDALPLDVRVMLKLTIPTTKDLYAGLTKHPNVARVVALSGGYSRAEACRLLAQNHGMIASFSRALAEDLRASMSDDEFHAALARSIDEIYRASSVKTAA